MDQRAAQLRNSVREAYSKAATEPEGDHPFPVGREFAFSIGYPRELLEAIPEASVESFAGVSNVSVFATLPAGCTVVDLGCGSGLDSFVAARRVGPHGRVVGIDFSEAMLSRASCSLRGSTLSNLLFVRSAAERLPLADASIDQALVNGIFNLNPFRDQIVTELARVLKPGGSVFGAELVLKAPLDEGERSDASNWFS
jgi:arsenite methyltransferase